MRKVYRFSLLVGAHSLAEAKNEIERAVAHVCWEDGNPLSEIMEHEAVPDPNRPGAVFEGG